MDGWTAASKQVAKAQLDEDMCVEAIASYIKANDPSYYAEVRREGGVVLIRTSVCLEDDSTAFGVDRPVRGLLRLAGKIVRR